MILNKTTTLLLLGMMVTASVRHAVGEESGATVEGKVNFSGKLIKREPIQMTDESRNLYKTVPLQENLIVGENGGLANVFVYVKEGLKKSNYPLPDKPAVLNQDKSMFRPRVLGVMAGQDVLMKNSDPMIHNVRSLSTKNRPFNIAQPANTPDRKKVFTAGEKAIQIGCDFHPWMKAFIFVMEHPYFAVSNAQGQFKIEGLPAGDYTLAAWHETFGEKEVKITVGASGFLKIVISFVDKK